MNKPVPEAFGLTNTDIESLKPLNENVSGWIFLGLITTGIVGGILYAVLPAMNQPGPEPVLSLILGIFLFGATGFAQAFLLGLFLSAYWMNIAALFSRRMSRFNQYQRTKRIYDQWVLRIQKEYWLSLSGSQFEQELAGLYKRMGYEVVLTPSSGDKGIDIILKRDNHTTIVQCKATKRPVGPAVARELYGTLIESGMDNAVLASISGCTTGVQSFIAGKPISIVTLNDIIKFQQRLVIPTS